MNSVKAELFYLFYTAPIPLPLRDFRAFAYFCIRYSLKLGFLYGLPRSRKLDYPLALLGPQNKFLGGYGFRWHFRQGLWYRWIVDREISRLKSAKLV